MVRTFIPPVKAAAETITGTPEEQAEKLISILNGMHIHIGNDKGDVKWALLEYWKTSV